MVCTGGSLRSPCCSLVAGPLKEVGCLPGASLHHPHSDIFLKSTFCSFWTSRSYMFHMSSGFCHIFCTPVLFHLLPARFPHTSSALKYAQEILGLPFPQQHCASPLQCCIFFLMFSSGRCAVAKMLLGSSRYMASAHLLTGTASCWLVESQWWVGHPRSPAWGQTSSRRPGALPRLLHIPSQCMWPTWAEASSGQSPCSPRAAWPETAPWSPPAAQ